jgi:hypothetical protein
LRGRSGDLFVAWFRYAIPIGAVPKNVTARSLRYAANYTRLRRRFTHAPNGWGLPSYNAVEQYCSTIVLNRPGAELATYRLARRFVR